MLSSFCVPLTINLASVSAAPLKIKPPVSPPWIPATCAFAVSSVKPAPSDSRTPAGCGSATTPASLFLIADASNSNVVLDQLLLTVTVIVPLSGLSPSLVLFAESNNTTLSMEPVVTSIDKLPAVAAKPEPTVFATFFATVAVIVTSALLSPVLSKFRSVPLSIPTITFKLTKSTS